jgi:hypothetical protein
MTTTPPMAETRVRPPPAVELEAPTRPEPHLEPPPTVVPRRHVSSLVPPFAAGLASYLGTSFVFPLLSVNHDESAYLLQAETLRHGALTLHAPPHPGAFVPWLATLRDGEFVFKYTPFHSGLLALGRTVFGSYRASIAVIAILCVAAFGFVARQVLPTRRSATIATWFFAMSPLVLVQSATYLSYLSSLLFLLLFVGAYLRAFRSGSAKWWAVAGLAGGFAFAARPFDALLVLLPFGVHLGVSWRRRNIDARTVLALAAGAIPPLAALAITNALTTGNPLVLPFSLLDPLDRVGFGWRRLHPTNNRTWYGPGEALHALWLHLLWLPVFVFGGPVLLFLAGRARLKRLPLGGRLLAATAVTVPLGYMLFWGPYNMSVLWAAQPIRYLGPFYWLPVVVPASLLAASGLRRFGRAMPRLLPAVVVAMLCVELVAVGYIVDRNLEYTRQAQVLQAGLPDAGAGPNRIVFVPQLYGPYLMHPLAFIADRPDYGGRVLYALDRGRDNFPVMADHPDRKPFRMRVNGTVTDQPDTRAVIAMETIDNVTAPAYEMHVTVRNPTGRRHVMLQVLLHGREDWLTLDHQSTRGEVYDVRFRVSPSELEPISGSISHEFHNRRKQKGLPFTISAVFSPTESLKRRTVIEWLVWDRITPDGELVLQTPFDARRMTSWPNGAWEVARKTKDVRVEFRTIGDGASGDWRPAGAGV